MVRRELLVLSLYQLLANNRGSLFLVFFPLFLTQVRGASYPFALIVVSAGYVSASLFAPLVGRWSDRVGRRKPFLLVAEIGAVPLIVTIALVNSLWVAAAAFVASQIVLAIGSPALNAFVSDLTRDAERAEGYAWLNAAANSGAVVGFLVVGVLIATFGYGVFLPFTIAVMVGTITILAAFVPDLRLPPSPGRRPIRELKDVTVFSFTVSIRALGAGAVGTFYALFAASVGASGFDVALIAVAGLVTGALLSIPVGKLIDRRGEIWGIFWGTILTLGGIVIFLLATNWVEVFPAQMLRVLGITFLSPAMLAWVSHKAPVGRRAEYLGFFSLINSTMWSLGPLAGGISLALGGTVALFGFSIGTTLISIAAIEGLYLRGRHLGFRPPDSGEARARASPVEPSAAGERAAAPL